MIYSQKSYESTRKEETDCSVCTVKKNTGWVGGGSWKAD